MSQDPFTLATEINELIEEGIINSSISCTTDLEQALEIAAEDDELTADTFNTFKKMNNVDQHSTFENLGQLR